MISDYNRFGRMTMDVHHHRNVTAASSSPPSRYSPPAAVADMAEQVTSLPAVSLHHQRPQKRSFDVAFLMAPDDLSKRRPRPPQPILQPALQTVARSAFTKVSPDPAALSPSSSPATPPPIEFGTYLQHQHQQHHQQHQHHLHHQQECSLSPPLPPAATHFMSPFPLGFRTPFAMMMPSRPQLIAAAGCKEYSSASLQSHQQHHPHHHHPHQQLQQQQQQEQQQQQPTSLPAPSPLQFGPAAAAAAAVAALPAMLLPASIAAAALTLPSQNVCAKCNVSFRMTSDLVYHMRSHHKGDGSGANGVGGAGGVGGGSDAKKRRDMDKLRCPVCDESFRERHHLTRHMTAHQDKEGDRLDDEDDAPLQQRPHQHQQQQGAK